jgi:hypothetical protein
MTLKVIHPRNLGKWLDLVKSEGRRQLFSVAANAVRILVRNHLSRIAPRHHISAHRLGATPTGHIEKGARATHFTASPDSAEVIIPIAGLSRAFRPLTITPRTANALTLPVSSHSYGKRVGELRASGWNIFRTKGKDALWGKLQDEDDAVPLYALKKRVQLKQDRSLLPSDAELGGTASKAMLDYIRRTTRRSA